MSVLVHGDTVRRPELRHEVPLWIPDAFFYVAADGRRAVAISHEPVTDRPHGLEV